ncbi:MAG: hypothetical protein NVSMB14_12690 [Isosphaeraceae bacterium]
MSLDETRGADPMSKVTQEETNGRQQPQPRDEQEFMEAMRKYREDSGRMFPTWSEVLEVLRGLGYEKDSKPSQRECA